MPFLEFILTFWPPFCCWLFFEIWYHIAQAGVELLVLLFIFSPCWDYRLAPMHLTLISVLSDFLVSVTHLVRTKDRTVKVVTGKPCSPRNPAASLMLSSLQGLLWNIFLTLDYIVPRNSPLTFGLCLRTKSLYLICGSACLLSLVWLRALKQSRNSPLL